LEEFAKNHRGLVQIARSSFCPPWVGRSSLARRIAANIAMLPQLRVFYWPGPSTFSTACISGSVKLSTLVQNRSISLVLFSKA